MEPTALELTARYHADKLRAFLADWAYTGSRIDALHEARRDMAQAIRTVEGPASTATVRLRELDYAGMLNLCDELSNVRAKAA